MVEVKIPPVTTSFFIVFPTLALACGVAIVASPEPRSWYFLASMVTCWIFLRGAAWFMQKNREQVSRLEQIENAVEQELGLDVTSDGKTEEPNSEHPQTAYNHVHLYKIVQGLFRPQPHIIRIQHASVISSIIILGIRIFSFGRFDTHPASIDFGPHPDNLGIEYHNDAFQHGVESFFNVLQGAVASFFSYPAVVGLIARVFTTADGDSLLLKKPNVYIIFLCEIISAVMTIFPSAVVAAALANEYDIFANSPHLRKLAEWNVGYSLGISTGMYFSCIVTRVIFLISGILNALEDGGHDADKAISYVVDKLAVPSSFTSDDDEVDDEDDEKNVKYGFGKGIDFVGVVVKPVEFASKIITLLCLFLLAVTTLLNGVFLGATWNYDAVDKTSAVVICINIGVVAFVFCVISLSTSKSF